MGKVRLTQAQADVVEDALGFSGTRERLVEEFIKYRLLNDVWAAEGLQVLNEFTTEKLIKTLYIGYEVEPEFKVGDWVFIDYGEAGTEIGFIKGWVNEPHSFYIDKCHFGANVNEARHATPEEIAEEKERRWWEKHGRDVWELKQGDILMGIHRALYEVTADPKSHRFGYYTGNDSRDFEIGECKRDGWRVVCFAEDRKDIDAE